MINLRMKILEELGDDLGGNIQFDVGYYENRTSRCSLASSDDLKVLYNIFEGKDKKNLWCNASDGNSNSSSKTKKRKRESDDENIDTIYRDLKEKHGDAYSIPQLRLWARML